jgi:hypothetical protein
MDTVDPATDLPRYVAATRESGVWRQRPNGVWFNTGQYGYGRGIYINNALDIQQESRGFFGGYTLRGDWVNPGKSRYWNGPFYEPPGVFIELVEVLNPDNIRCAGLSHHAQPSRAARCVVQPHHRAAHQPEDDELLLPQPERTIPRSPVRLHRATRASMCPSTA